MTRLPLHNLAFAYIRTRLGRSHHVSLSEFMERPEYYKKMHRVRIAYWRRCPKVLGGLFHVHLQ